VLALGLLFGCTQKTNLEAEKANVKAVLEKYHKALETDDLEAISKLYVHDDDVVQFNDVGRCIGWREIESTFQGWFKVSEDIKFAFKDEIINVHDSGKCAWVSFIQYGSITHRGEPSSFDNCRVTLVLVKQDGNWLITQAHFSGEAEASLGTNIES
jgi:uncharacterized protein (TIGR02246 family)